MMWLLWLGLVLVGLATAVVALSMIGARQWSATTRTMTRGLDAVPLDATVKPSSPMHYDSRELEGPRQCSAISVRCSKRASPWSGP